MHRRPQAGCVECFYLACRVSSNLKFIRSPKKFPLTTGLRKHGPQRSTLVVKVVPQGSEAKDSPYLPQTKVIHGFDLITDNPTYFSPFGSVPQGYFSAARNPEQAYMHVLETNGFTTRSHVARNESSAAISHVTRF